MNVTFRFKLLAVCAGCVLGMGLLQRGFAEETNLLSPRQAEAARDSLNALLQIQDQLHAMQLLIESNRVVAAAEAQRSTADLSARMQVLEQTVAAQRTSEIEATQKAQRLTLILAGAFGVLGLTAMFLMAFFQWRAVTRMVELSAFGLSARGLEDRGASPMLSEGEVHNAPERAAVQLSNARLFNVVERLEKRILELEHTARAPLGENAAPSGDGHNGAPLAATDRGECIANLLAEGQLSLDRGELAKALECFEHALALDPKHAEALIKKAAALEKLNRFEEALECYDDAIAADGSMTIAYLHKGGLFNRMSRYEEALQCYEHALHTHDKRAAGEKAAA
jgi:tetratricopeptide (TPR) repeat protein